ncbi:hypothetical protein ACQP2T_61795 [Nonomuraea sp. CA-143628]|uniref:hypothetical protein n=1 Tax=Nonomuraea sp. CA-143628 TaxID=3239997 RepID=UPI003D937F38
MSDEVAIRVAPELDGRQTARVGYANVCKEIADHAAGKVATRDDANAAPGDFIEHALQGQRMWLEQLHRSITQERMNGTSWETIAGKMRLPVAQVRNQFEHCDLNHLAEENGETGVWRVLAETCVAPIPGMCDSHPGKVALELDDWYRAYATGQPGDPAGAATPNPVTAHL